MIVHNALGVDSSSSPSCPRRAAPAEHRQTRQTVRTTDFAFWSLWKGYNKGLQLGSAISPGPRTCVHYSTYYRLLTHTQRLLFKARWPLQTTAQAQSQNGPILRGSRALPIWPWQTLWKTLTNGHHVTPPATCAYLKVPGLAGTPLRPGYSAREQWVLSKACRWLALVSASPPYRRAVGGPARRHLRALSHT